VRRTDVRSQAARRFEPGESQPGTARSAAGPECLHSVRIPPRPCRETASEAGRRPNRNGSRSREHAAPSEARRPCDWGSNPATPVSRRVTRNPAARRPDSGTVCYIPEDSEPRLSRRAPPRRAFDHPAPDSVDGGQVSHALGRKSRVVGFVCPGERVGNAATGTPGSGVCGSTPEALPGSVRREAGSRHLVSNWPINVCK